MAGNMDVQRTFTPQQDISPERPVLGEELLDSLGASLKEVIDSTKGQRAILDQTLDYWDDMVEMNTAPRNEPWPDAKNMCVPIVAMMMEAVQSRLTSAVFVPRLYVINALDQQATQYVHDTENFYNAEFRRRKWLRPHLDVLNLSLRDGVGIMEVLWDERIIERNVVVMEPTAEVGPDGKPKKRKTIKKAKIVDYKGVRLESVELRDFFLSPAVSRDPQKASAVFRKLYLTEAQLWELASGENPTLIKERVEAVIAYHTTGQNDLQSDDQGTATYQQGGVLTIGDEGSMDPTLPDGTGTKSKGIFEVWRVHTNEYDLDNDGVPEENVLWMHDLSYICMGAAPYEYWHGKRPFVKCAPMPRPNRFQGWSVPERLRGYQEEANARSNQRGDAMDIKINPPIYVLAGAKPIDKDKKWGPGAEWEVPSKDAVGIIDIGTIDPASWQDEMLTYRYAAAMVGIESPTMPLSGNQKVPMKQQQQQMMASNVRLDLMALEVRLFCEEVLEMVHQLNLQYGEDDQTNDLGGQGLETLATSENGGFTKLQLPLEAMAQNYHLGVAGTEGALDQDSAKQQAMTLYALMLQNPLVQGNLKRVHAVTSYVLDHYNLPQYEKFIGTDQDAEQQQQAMAQAAEKKHQEELQLQLLSHSKNAGSSKTASPVQPSPQGMMPGA